RKTGCGPRRRRATRRSPRSCASASWPRRPCGRPTCARIPRRRCGNPKTSRWPEVSEATPAAPETAPDLDAAFAVTTVRDGAARAQLRAAIRELGREGGGYTAERLARLIRLEDHFQALLLYGQLE